MTTTTVTSRRSVGHLPRPLCTHAQADAQSENNASGGIHRTGGGITTVICNDEELDSSKHMDRKLGNIPRHSVSKFLGTEPSSSRPVGSEAEKLPLTLRKMRHLFAEIFNLKQKLVSIQ